MRKVLIAAVFLCCLTTAAMASALHQKQVRFTQMVAQLILHAHELGYQVTFGDAYRPPATRYGHPASLHQQRLAIDLNLFKDGVYLRTAKEHQPLGEYWESLGGSWGGRFGDANHYSLAHGGMQ